MLRSPSLLRSSVQPLRVLRVLRAVRPSRWLVPLLLGLTMGAAIAAPAPVIPVTVGQNNGYITLQHPDSDGFLESDPVCPLGAHIERSWSREECVDEHGEQRPLVHVQDALDQRFGKGKAQAVGYVPTFDNETIVFVRLMPTGH